jgi:molybdate transport system ATP-binding protein
MTMLTVDVAKQFGEFSLTVAFAAESGVTALFGPSGAGKTTVINMIAGLLRPDRGRIVLDNETLFEAEASVDMPAHRRRIGVVFQEGRLFPHLSVKHNLDYGRWMSGLAADAHAFAHAVELLDIGHLLDRRPGKLSGGERQRVAIGRALLMRPRLLLLDEPLASLDATRKGEILPYLERLRDDARVPMIYVSHNADEVRRLATRAVMLDGGCVTAAGAAQAVMPREGGASSNQGAA